MTAVDVVPIHAASPPAVVGEVPSRHQSVTYRLFLSHWIASRVRALQTLRNQLRAGEVDKHPRRVWSQWWVVHFALDGLAFGRTQPFPDHLAVAAKTPLFAFPQIPFVKIVTLLAQLLEARLEF